MTTPVESIAQAASEMGHLLVLLNNADQVLEQVLTLSKHYQENVPDPHDLESVIQAVRHEIAQVAAKHDELVAKLHEAGRHASEHAAHQEEEDHP